jgi:hypothetical protein
MTILLLNSVLRFIGHLQEPVPPGVSSSSAALDKSDNFEHVCSKALFGQNSWPRLVLLLPLIGIVSEFASGLPFRLSVVQAFCVASNLGLPMSPLATWRKCAADADRIRHGGGWRASPTARSGCSNCTASTRPEVDVLSGPRSMEERAESSTSSA